MAAPQAPPTRVTLPRAFESYACQRTLACCRAPMRAPVDDEEIARVSAAMEAAEAGEAGQELARELDAQLENYLDFDFKIIRLEGRDCAMLDAREPACRLQRAGGLAAVPEGCRNFPRSVVTRPDGGLEVAFTMRCPTAAGMLVEAADQVFALARRDEPAWVYPPTRDCETELPVMNESRAVADVDALRAGWWRILAEVTDGAGAIAALGALYQRPDRPRPAPDGPQDDLLIGLEGFRLLEVQRAIEAIPKRGRKYARFEWHTWSALSQSLTRERLLSMAEADPTPLMAYAANWIQWAGVHDPRPFEAAAWVTIRRTLTALRLFHCFLGLMPVPRRLAWQDAYTAAAHLDVRWQ